MRKLLFIITCLLTAPLLAQFVPGKISPALQSAIENAGRKELNLFVHGNVPCISALVSELDGIVKLNSGRVLSVRIPADKVHLLSASSCVESFEYSVQKPYLLNDSSRVKSRIQWVNDGLAPLQRAYDGSGVVMGIIDTGLDMEHPDFLNPDSSTRVVKFWDQTKPVNANTPAQYGYGQVCDSAAINAGTCTFGEQGGSFGHGTTVTSTTSGTGFANGLHRGGAPGTDLLIVSSNFNDPNWTSTVADAVDWIFAEAEAMGKPAVINASLGSYLGSHDGKDAAALIIDSLIQAKTGRVMVAAAGNSFGWPAYHMSTSVNADTSFTWFEYNASSALGHGAVYFELWADTAELNNVQFAVGADRVNPSYTYRGNTVFRNIQDALGGTLIDSLFSNSGNLLGVVEYFGVLRGGQYQLSVHMNEPDSNDHYFRFMSTGSGSYDVWTADFFGLSAMVNTIPSSAQYPAISDYVLPDNNKTIVSSWACSDQVITVANYSNEVNYIDVNGAMQTVGGTEGDISGSSSSGPTRDGRTKPDLAAPGDITLVAAPFLQLNVLTQNEPFKVAQGGMHIRQGGTSIAAPAVSAAVALYLEQCNWAPHFEVINAFKTTAFGDAFATSLPNNRWGSGKINAFDAISPTAYKPGISVFGDSTICPGDSLLFSGPLLDGFTWSTGDSTKVFWLDTAATIWLITQDVSGCLGYSDTINIIQHPAPQVPTINQNGNVLMSSSAASYQWLFNGGPIGGQTNQTISATTNGNYQVLTTDVNGCQAVSDTLSYVHVGVDESPESGLKIWPSPSDGPVNIDFGQVFTGSITITDMSGRIYSSREVNAIKTLRLDNDLPNGSYLLITNSGERRSLHRFEILR